MKLITRKLLPLCAALLTSPAQAYSFQMDTFTVGKNFNPTELASPAALLNTQPIFYDNFADLNAPPSAPNFIAGGLASYSTFGSVGPESVIGGQGILTLNSTGTVQAILNTNVTSDPTLGLKQSNTNFVVGGIFNLINPGNGVGSYGVRFTDAGAGNGNDIVSLSVHGDVNGGAVIQFSRFDGVRNVVSQQTLDTNHDQISLGLTYIDPDGGGAAPKAVYAAYFYLDKDALNNDVPTSSFINMAGSANLFTDESFTRAALFAAATNPVPEPAEYALMLVGLGLVGWAVRRKQR